MVGLGGSSAGSYLADPTSPIPFHCASIVVTSTLRANTRIFVAGILPVMHMEPRMDFVPNEADYKAPLYKTGVRAGVLSTTGM